MARTLVASDNFNRANGAIGSNWTYIRDSAWQGAAPTISSNVVVPGATGDHYQLVRWTGAGTFSNDQYAKATVGSLTWQDGTYRAGVAVRISADLNTTADYYAFWVQDDGPSNRTSKLVKVVDGTETVLDSRSTAWANGDTISLEASGTTISAYKNDALMFSVTDSALSTGKPGFMIAGGGGVPTVDNWEGGDLGSSGVNGTATSSGVSASGAVGTSTAAGAATVAAGGVSATAAVGTASASGTTPVYATPAGVSSSAAIGAAAVSAGASASPAGVSVLATIGQAIAGGDIHVNGAALPAGVIAYSLVGAAVASDGSVVYARAPAGNGYRRQFKNTTRPASGNNARPRNEQ